MWLRLPLVTTTEMNKIHIKAAIEQQQQPPRSNNNRASKRGKTHQLEQDLLDTKRNKDT